MNFYKKIKMVTGIIKFFDPFTYTRLMRALSGHGKKTKELTRLNTKEIREHVPDTAKKIFIDCGVNEGLILSAYDDLLPDFDLVGFEIQSELIPIAKSRSPRSEIRNEAVSTKNSKLQFYLPKNYGENFRGGATLNPNKIKSKHLLEVRSIKSIDFIEFLEALKNKYTYIVCKMDIEGSEYAIIDKLYGKFTINGVRLIDYLIIEFHPSLIDTEITQSDYETKLQDMGIKYSNWL